MKNICYIVGAGNTDNIILAPGKDDFVIAADAGFKVLEMIGVEADLVVGDFDSLGNIPKHEHILQHPAEKDDTDMILAVNEGLRIGFKTFVIYGGLGGRLDHTYANIQTLSYLTSQGATGYLVGEGIVITALKNATINFDKNLKGMISIFCHGDTAKGVYLNGLKYPLHNATLTCNVPLGVSNEFIGYESSVTVKDGTLVIMWHQEPNDFIDTLHLYR